MAGKNEGLHVNFSTEELSSESRTFTPVPTGTYRSFITKIDDKTCGPDSKNPGKPYWAIEVTAQDAPYTGRKFFSNAMLFDGALYTIVQLMKALGMDKELSSGTIPGKSEFIAKEVDAVVVRRKDSYAIDQEKESGSWDGKPIFKNEITGFKKHVAPSGSGFLLP